jgi:hypothetical protein
LLGLRDLLEVLVGCGSLGAIGSCHHFVVASLRDYVITSFPGRLGVKTNRRCSMGMEDTAEGELVRDAEYPRGSLLYLVTKEPEAASDLT